MILQNIFRGATLTALHTGTVARIAATMGSENPITTGVTSFSIGIPFLLAGAYAGDRIARHDTHDKQIRASTTLGLIGYAAGSAIGFAFKHS